MKRVMIVDDNYLSVAGIKKNINWEQLDAEVVFEENDGYSAIKDMKEKPVNLIISDIEMPNMDGIEMCNQAILINPQVKILLISAFSKFEYAKRAIRIGVFDYIEKPIDYKYLFVKIKTAFQVIDQDERNKQIIEKSRPAIMANFFNKLITYEGSNAEEHFCEYVDYLQLNTHFSNYITLIIKIENASDIETRYGIVQYNMSKLNLIDEAKESGCIFDWFYETDSYDAFICYIGQNTQNTEHLLQAMHKYSENLYEYSENTLLNISIGIGAIIDNIWQMHISYENANNALKYSFCFPHKGIYDVNDIKTHSFTLTAQTDTNEEKLLQLLGCDNQDGISSWLDDYYAELLSHSGNKNILFTRTYNLVGHILKFLYELSIDSSDLEKDIADLYAKFDKFNNYQQLYDWTYKFCLAVCSKLSSSTMTYHNQICNSVQNFIAQNYSDSSLCLGDIAKNVGISNAYLSALYKKQTGRTINDTITEHRITKACFLLSKTNTSLKSISTECGYSNQYYFSNSFKKKTGMSPSAYREENSTQEL